MQRTNLSGLECRKSVNYFYDRMKNAYFFIRKKKLLLCRQIKTNEKQLVKSDNYLLIKL